MEMFIQHGIPFFGKKAFELGRYVASEAIRNPNVSKKITKKGREFAQKGVNYAVDNLSEGLIDKASDWLRPEGYVKGGNYADWYPMGTYTDTSDPTNPLYEKSFYP